MKNRKRSPRTIKRNFSFHNFLYNDKYILIFSICMAFVIWIIVSSTSSDPDVKTITDISISIPNLSDGLEVMKTEDTKAEIRIKGNKLVIGSVQSSDILVSADVSEVNKPGEYKLKLSAKKQGILSDYEFDSTVTPSTITAYVDRRAEKILKIEEDVQVQTGSEYLKQQNQLSVDTIKLSGAETYINRIATVKAEYTSNETLTETKTFDVPLRFYDEDGAEVSNDYVTAEFDSVQVTVPVLKVKQVPIKVEFTNIPDSWEMPDNWVSIESPESGYIQLAASDEVIDSITEIKTEPVDLSQISAERKTMSVSIEVPTSCTNVDRIEKVTLKFNTDKFTSKSFTVSNVELRSNVSGVTGKLSGNSFNVTIVGPENEVNAMKASDITLYATLTESESTAAFITKPLQISIDGYKSCWWNYSDGENHATFTLTNKLNTSSSPSVSSSASNH
ncbi:MAG: YbbR-like domain-containing protein [Pseudoruminococcus massiliensis]|jgi:SHS2 domain-containing protein